MILEVELALEKECAKLLGLEPSKGSGSLILILLRFDLTKSLIALAIIVTSMGWGFPVAGTALGVELGPADGLAGG